MPVLSFNEKVSLTWFLLDTFTHLTIELGYVYLTLTTTAEKSDSLMGGIWRQYARADSRWEVRDTTILSIEIATVVVGLLCAVQVFGIYTRASWRHVLQVLICTAELYGGWMTFAPEWLDGSPHLNGSDFALMWIYLVFMNGLWVVLPLILLWDSIAKINQSVRHYHEKEKAPSAEGAPSQFWWNVAAGFLVMYLILVPAVLSTAVPVPVKP